MIENITFKLKTLMKVREKDEQDKLTNIAKIWPRNLERQNEQTIICYRHHFKFSGKFKNIF